MTRAFARHALAAASILAAGLSASSAWAAEEAIGVVSDINLTECTVTLTSGATFYEPTEERESSLCDMNVLLGEHVLISYRDTDGDNVIASIRRYNGEDAIGQVAAINASTLTLANGESFDLEALTKPAPAISVGDYVLVQFTESGTGRNIAATVALANAATDRG
jgi:hypothetical protein